MTLLSALLALLLAAVPIAGAAPEDDLNQAAAADLPVQARQEAFNRLVALGNTDLGLVSRVANTEAEDTRRRWVAIRVIGHVGGDAAESTLTTLLADPQPAIRAAAVGALGETGKRAHTARVVALLEDPAVTVRAEAATALGKIGDPAAVPALSKAIDARASYHRDASLWVRRHYVMALGAIGHKDAVPALLRALDDADPVVSEAAVPAFERIGGFTMGEGRTPEQQREAWRRWGQAQVQ